MNRRLIPLLAVLLAAGATGCGERSESIAANGVLQTKAPGHVAAGGRTSGAVLAAPGNGAVTDRPPSGTPGTPQGMEGNTGGTAMGGTSASRKEVADPPAPAASAAAAERQQQLLAASMDAVAAHWRARAAGQGWPTHPPTPVAQQAGIQASAEPTSQPPAMPIRSEKRGTAPPSEDVKAPGNAPTDLSIGRQAPDAATAK